MCEANRMNERRKKKQHKPTKNLLTFCEPTEKSKKKKSPHLLPDRRVNPSARVPAGVQCTLAVYVICLQFLPSMGKQRLKTRQ